MENKHAGFSDEFYIGYLPSAPSQTANLVKITVIILAVLVATVCAILVIHQKKFATSNFEYGIPCTIEGNIFTKPFPHLVIEAGVNTEGKKESQVIMLVGFGKKGADEYLKTMEAELGSQINGQRMRVTGSLIYGDGKALLQVDMDAPFQLIDSLDTNQTSFEVSKLESLTGKIVDPKCYFGVMKPGEGKPHRSCAIRCLAGGIPPVFHANNHYYVLVSKDQKSPTQSILSLVDDTIELQGRVLQVGDWNILEINPSTIDQLAKEKLLTSNLAALNAGIAMCSNK